MSFLYYISSFIVSSGIVIAIIIAIDLIKRPQKMKIMNIVWVLTALWASYIGLWAYLSFGREGFKEKNVESLGGSMPPITLQNSMSVHHDNKMENMNMSMPKMNMKKRPYWQSVTLSAMHCGAGCTLADIIGEWTTYFWHFKVGNVLFGSWIIDFIIAISIGVYFQYAAISEMQKISFKEGIKKAFKADFFSLTSWQIGMFGWTAICYYLFYNQTILPKTDFPFWFMMQIAMLFGFVCAYPMNMLLIKLGIKKGM